VFLDPGATIPEEKLTRYLLVLIPKGDKSKFLAQAGYTIANWQQLEQDLRTQILPRLAIATENTKFGQKYQIDGMLSGSNGVELRVRTVWIMTAQETRFVTLVPGG